MKERQPFLSSFLLLPFLLLFRGLWQFDVLYVDDIARFQLIRHIDRRRCHFLIGSKTRAKRRAHKATQGGETIQIRHTERERQRDTDRQTDRQTER